MYRKVNVNDRLPEVGKFVTTIDEAGEHRVFRLTEHGWNAREVNGVYSPKDNLPILFWLEEVPMDSRAILGTCNEEFVKISDHHKLDWTSYYEGWNTGRMNLAFGY